MERSAGVIMHIASLPGKFGIGTFGREAYEYVEFLFKSGLKYWQILPLGQTGYGDSPYQSFSAFAGNPYFIDFDILNKEGLLREEEYVNENYGDNSEYIDYGLLFEVKYNVLRKAYNNFKNLDNKYLKEEFSRFMAENTSWLDDYALYMAIKARFNLSGWQEWDEDIKKRQPEAMDRYKRELSDEIQYWSFIQFMFFKQWNELKKYANEKGIEIIGDMPIYVAEDSADVWSNPEAYLIYEDTLKPISVAGCPPDAFSATGQLWGNPLYDWNYMEKTGYKWWIKRVKESLKLYDVLRIDHFRGFESYWEIPYGEDTAINGRWVKGPGIKLFNAIRQELGEINVIAEDLGFLTDEVINFLEETGFPGMKVLQFAFDSREESNYLPHTYNNNCIAYTGTHDNDTFRGWFDLTGSREDIEYCKNYLALSESEGYNWGFIRGAWSSVADVSVALMQDFLDLGNETRVNFPSTLGNNWKWRLKEGSCTTELANKIYEYTKMYGRCK